MQELVMDEGAIGFLHKVVVRVNILRRVGQFHLGVLQVHGELTAWLSNRLPTELAVILVVLSEVGESVGAESARFCGVNLARVEGDQCWGDLAVVQYHVIVLEGLLAHAEVHEAKVDSISVHSL